MEVVEETTTTVDEKSEMICKLQEELAALRESARAKDEQVETLAKSIQEVNDARLMFENNYQVDITEMKNLARQHTDVYEKEKTVQIVEMQSTIDEQTDVINRLQEELDNMKDLSLKKDEHIDSLATRIKEVNDASAQFEVQYQTEINEMKNLARHHSDAYEKEKKTNQKLLDTVEEMQKLLINGQQAQQDLEDTLTRATTDFQKVIKSKDETIKSLNEEIKYLKAQAAAKAQEDLEEEVDYYYPTASATNKIFKSNMSLSQIYNEYMAVQEKLEKSRAENNCLKEQIHRLIEEAEQKTPFIHHNVQENKKSLQTIKDLQIQLTKVTNEKDNLIEEKENLAQTSVYYKREIARLEQTCQDLSAQVRSLIKSVHEAKGYDLISQNPILEKGTEESTANRIITKHLITFGDIESLQVNNQRLISSVRDLALENERLVIQLREKETVSQKELNKAFEEIKKLTEERRRQAETLEELMETKNTFKSIHDPNESIRKSKEKNQLDMNETINEMKETIRGIQAEANKNRDEYEEKIKSLQDDINHYRHELALLQSEKAKTESENEFIQEKMKLLKANFELISKENSKLSDKSGKITRKLAKNEGNIAVLRKQLADAKVARDKLQANILALQSERDQLKNNEKLLNQEKESLKKDYQEKSKLVTTLQTIQESFSRLENESSKGLHLQISHLQKEVDLYRTKYTDEHQSVQNLISSHNQQINELQSRIDEELRKNGELRENLKLTDSRLQVLESELKVVRGNEERNRVKLDNPEQAKKIRDLEEKLTKSEEMCAKLKVENDQWDEKCKERVKKLATQARDRIGVLTQQKKKLASENEELGKKVAELETQIASLDTLNKNLTKRMEETEKLARNAVSQAKTFQTENSNLNKSNQELKEKVDSLESAAKKANIRLESLQPPASAIKLNRQLKAMAKSRAQLEQLENQYQAQLSSTNSQTVSNTPSEATASISGHVGTSSSNVPTPSSSSTSGPVRHPVLPQKQEPTAPKSMPRLASIRPVVAPRSIISRSMPSASGHSAVILVPNTEDSTQLVPQATVAPTVVTIPVAASVAASSSNAEPMMSSSTLTSSTSTTTSSSSIPLSSNTMSSSSSAAADSFNAQSSITSSEATPQPDRPNRPTEELPSTRESQSSELRITSSQGNLNQEPSVTTSDESDETSRQGVKRQRELPSTSTARPQIQDYESSKKAKTDEAAVSGDFCDVEEEAEDDNDAEEVRGEVIPEESVDVEAEEEEDEEEEDDEDDDDDEEEEVEVEEIVDDGDDKEAEVKEPEHKDYEMKEADVVEQDQEEESKEAGDRSAEAEAQASAEVEVEAGEHQAQETVGQEDDEKEAEVKEAEAREDEDIETDDREVEEKLVIEHEVDNQFEHEAEQHEVDDEEEDEEEVDEEGDEEDEDDEGEEEESEEEGDDDEVEEVEDDDDDNYV